MTATECTLRVNIADLARAVAAVAKHAEPQRQGTEQSILSRVRFTAGRKFVTVGATDGRSMALAWVPILADSRPKHYDDDDGPFVVDLYPRHARAIGNAVTPITKDGEQTGEAELMLSVNLVSISDVSGKYPDTAHRVRPVDQESTMPIEGTEEHGYPDIETDIRAAFRNAAGIFKPMLPPAKVMTRFEAAAAIFESRLVYEPVGDLDNRTWLVWARTVPFVGLLWHTNEDDTEKRRRAAQRVGHLRRIGGILSAEDEAKIELGGDLAGELDDPEAEQNEYRAAALAAEAEEREEAEVRRASLAAEFEGPGDEGGEDR